MDFTASFPHLVRSISLLAPVGMLRGLPTSYEELRRAARDGKGEQELKSLLAEVLGVEDDVEELTTASGDEQSEGSIKQSGVDAAAIVRWQYYQHQGHAASFISTLQHGPLQDQHETWREACRVLRDKSRACGEGKRLLVMCGSDDTVVPARHVKEDLDVMMSTGEYVLKLVRGGHGFLLEEAACQQVIESFVDEWKP